MVLSLSLARSAILVYDRRKLCSIQFQPATRNHQRFTSLLPDTHQKFTSPPPESHQACGGSLLVALQRAQQLVALRVVAGLMAGPWWAYGGSLVVSLRMIDELDVVLPCRACIRAFQAL